ncbi:L-rhamnose mutarotase [Limisphaera ngatamarikiensis]|uniref:L-rhamnose mutarotase n=2 Tax=Limisphaera ngatamarikiensis TaxID=1324935 RepID=A0A6M1RD72_9BACT|nr:L-rhamnose mutarotase [Limisphaera ngatamarikiensis]
MRLRGFAMKLKPGCAEEYRRRHDALWPELAALLRESGISDYAIFLDAGTNTLFAVQKLGSGFDAEALRRHPVMRRWWAYMADLMEVQPDGAPVEVELDLMFYLP